MKKDKNLQLADAKNAKPADKGDHKHELVVNVDWDGVNNVAQFSMDGVNYPSADSMQGVLAAGMRRTRGLRCHSLRQKYGV